MDPIGSRGVITVIEYCGGGRKVTVRKAARHYLA